MTNTHKDSLELESITNEPHTQTRRATVPALEKILYAPINVLDHGFVRVIDYMGDDSAIVQAARVSYGKGTKQVSQDKGLINYLMRHSHTTPFEMCDIKFHIKLPIFVARQWIRHRTASVNEYSARYSILGNEFYLPAKENLASQSKANRQGRSDDAVPDDVAARVLAMLKNDATTCYDHYITMMNEDDEGNVITEDTIGITRELARMNLTLNYYTEWYWKINLHNLLHFLRLRADNHAQYEIRVYAEAMLEIVKAWVPYAFEAFEEHCMKAAHFSRSGVALIKRMIAGEEVTEENSGMSKREFAEVMQLIGR
jgi:thymidylate synthase (FAD)